MEKVKLTFQSSYAAGELSDVQSTVQTAIIDSLRYWAIRDHGYAFKLRGDTAVHIHMIQLL